MAAKKLIRITYEIWDEEAREIGETDDKGWIDEDGESMMPADYWDDQGSAVKNAIDYLFCHHGPTLEPSESGRGAASRWYTDYEYDEDFRTGKIEQRSYHLHGFNEADRRKIQKAIEKCTYRNNPAGDAIIGRIGDVDPIEYGGGVVFQTEHGPVLEVTHGLESNEGRSKLEIYHVNIEPDVIKDLNWVDMNGWKSIASTIDISVKDLKKAAKSHKVMDRVFAYEAVASTHGWQTLDPSPLQLTVKKLEKRWYPED